MQVPFLETAWTTPFFLPGTVLATALPGRTIRVAPAAGPAPTLVGGTGGRGTAAVVQPDVEPCKVGFVAAGFRFYRLWDFRAAAAPDT